MTLPAIPQSSNVIKAEVESLGISMKAHEIPATPHTASTVTLTIVLNEMGALSNEILRSLT